MTNTRWNYAAEQYEKYVAQAADASPSWVVDFDRQQNLRAELTDKTLLAELMDVANYSMTTICKRFAYSESYIRRRVDSILLAELENEGTQGKAIHDQISAIRKGNLDLDSLPKKDREMVIAVVKKIAEAKQKLLDQRPKETLQEKRARYKQDERTGSVFEALGIKLLG